MANVTIKQYATSFQVLDGDTELGCFGSDRAAVKWANDNKHTLAGGVIKGAWCDYVLETRGVAAMNELLARSA